MPAGGGPVFSTGLLTGVWKYAHIARSREAVAPVYVDIAHRSSLMYAFAACLMHGFMCMLVIGEVGGFAILFWGFLRAL